MNGRLQKPVTKFALKRPTSLHNTIMKEAHETPFSRSPVVESIQGLTCLATAN